MFVFEGYFKMLILLLCSLFLTSSTCDVISKDSKLGWNVDGNENDYDPWKRKYFTASKRLYWKTLTFSPDNEEENYPSPIDASHIILIVGLFFLTLIIGCGLAYCLKYICKNGECPCTTDSSSIPNTITIPRRITVPPPKNTKTITNGINRTPLTSAPPLFTVFDRTNDNIANTYI